MIEYRKLEDVNPDAFIPILNEKKLRSHLIEHELFDAVFTRQWIADKIKIDNQPGCYVKAVYINGQLAGWCGIQEDIGCNEIGVILSEQFWGYGVRIFHHLVDVARSCGHKEVVLNLLITRREYQFLDKIAQRVETREVFGGIFTSYYLSLEQ